MTYTLTYSTIDKGDPKCLQREKFENYMNSFWERGNQIQTNISNYEALVDIKADNLFYASRNFFAMAMYNAFSMATIWLAAFFSHSNSASVFNFLNFCEQNQKSIFTKEFYQEKVNVANSKVKLEKGKFSEILKECRRLLDDNADLIEKLIFNRNKIFAHFEKEFLINHKIQLTITIEDLKYLIKLAEEIVNNILCYYDRTYRIFSPLDILDLQQTIDIVDGFVKNKQTIIQLKNDGVLL